MPHILIPGLAKKGEVVLNVAKEMGLTVTIIDEKRADFLDCHSVNFVSANLNSISDVLEKANAINAEHKIDAVVPVLDRGVLPGVLGTNLRKITLRDT
jgi:hypothetical protein